MPLSSFEHVFFNKHISQFEEDDYENNFILFKENENDLFGEVWIRMYNMPIAIPMLANDSISELDGKLLTSDFLNIPNKEILRSIFNNCVEFGIFNKVFWIFGKYKKDNEEYYQLVSFSYTVKNGRFSVDPDSLIYYYIDEYNQKINYLNDFVGATYYENSLKFILFDTNKAHMDLIEYNEEIKNKLNNKFFKCQKLQSYEPKFILYSLDEVTNEVVKSNFSVEKMNFPMILNHFSTSNFQEENRIWKTVLKDDNFNILYMALNDVPISSGIFEYYFNETINETQTESNAIKIYIQIIYCKFMKDGISIYERKSIPLTFDEELIPDACIKKFDNFIRDLNKCYYSKNNELIVQFTPFNFGYEYSDKFRNILISYILEKLGVFKLGNLLNENNNIENQNKKLFDFKLLNEIFSNDNVQRYIKLNKDCIINNSVIDLFGLNNLLQKFGVETLKDYNMNIISDNFIELSADFIPLPVRLINETDENKIKIFGENGLGLNILSDDIIYSSAEENLNNLLKKANQQFGYFKLNNLNNFETFEDLLSSTQISLSVFSNEFKLYLSGIYENILETTGWDYETVIEYFNIHFKQILNKDVKFLKCENDDNIEDIELYNLLSSKYFINDLTPDMISSNLISFKNDFNLFKIIKPLYEYLPIIKKCSANKLSVSLVFKNDTRNNIFR